MAGPDSKEIELILEFRNKLSDLNLEDRFNTNHFLLRWIRARQHDLDQAEKMLRQHMKWRAENDVDNIMSLAVPENLIEEITIEFLGYDDENSPVVFVPAGSWDIKKILNMEENSTLLKFLNKFFQIMLQKMEGKFTPSGYPVTQFVIIIDHKGMSIWNTLNFRALDIRRQIIRMFEANLPETMKALYVVNCGAVYTTLFAILRPLLSAATVSKFNIFSTDESKWKPALLKKIPASVLNAQLGGTNFDTVKTAELMETTSCNMVQREGKLPLCESEIPLRERQEVDFGFE
jgi:hypothetical protein